MDFGPGQIGALVPIVAIVGAFSVAIIKQVVSAVERRHELMMMNRQAQALQPTSDSEIKALRDELAAFKDSSTKYDLSLDHVLQRLEHRIEFLEKKLTANGIAVPPEAVPEMQEPYQPKVAAPETPGVQIVGRAE